MGRSTIITLSLAAVLLAPAGWAASDGVPSAEPLSRCYVASLCPHSDGDASPIEATSAPATHGTILNGGFETGTLASWTHVNNGSGNWSTYNGNVSPISGHTIARPPEGNFAATTDQTGPGTHILAQGLRVPTNGTPVLSFIAYYENRASTFHSPPTLDWNGTQNQQYRIDLLNASAPLTSVEPAHVRANLFQTGPGAPHSMPPSRLCYDLDAYRGESLVLRFAQVDNQFFFQASVDDVRVSDACPPPTPPPPPPPANVDLTVTAPLAAHGPFWTDFRAVVENKGTGPATTNFTVEWHLDGSLIARQFFLAGYEAGRRTNISASAVPPPGPGTHTIQVSVDVHNNQTETNESNNVGITTFVIETPLPDLTVTPPTAPHPITNGTIVPFTTTVRNIGAASAPRNFTLEWRMDGNVVGRTWFDAGFPAGASINVTTYIEARGVGEHVMEVAVDVHDNITEKSEANNVARAPFKVEPEPDVAVRVVSLERVPLFTEAGDVRHPLSRWEAVVEVCNKGGAAPWVSLNTWIQGGTAGSATVGWETLSPLASGECVTKVVRFDTAGAVGDFRFAASAWAIHERNASNNYDEAKAYNVVGGEGGVALFARRV